jgi:hypothetical protein
MYPHFLALALCSSRPNVRTCPACLLKHVYAFIVGHNSAVKQIVCNNIRVMGNNAYFHDGYIFPNINQSVGLHQLQDYS